MGPTTTSPQALAGLRVLEMGHAIAGPFAGAMLAGFGAEVVKIEAPGVGDPLRRWGRVHDGTSLWWRSMARNKKSVALDLRQEEGRKLVRDLIAAGHVDVLIENFRPGRMESWGLGWPRLEALCPKLVMVRVSGWGQTGPRSQEPGYANIAESFGGLRFLTGEPQRAPVRSGVSIGDTLAGVHAAYGAMTALYHRDHGGEGRGQVVDVALYESVFNMLESVLPEYDFYGHVRQRQGTRLDGISPTNTYPCRAGDDGQPRYVVIGANSDPMYQRLMRTIGRAELADDPRCAHNDGRVEHMTEIDEAISAWTRSRTVEEALDILRAAEVACGPIQSIEDISCDPQFQARGIFDSVTLPDGKSLRIPAVLPKLAQTPGETQWIGPELGAHTDEVLAELLELAPDRIAQLRTDGIVA